ncbi:serine hydrolase domain-containing protein [Novosphingobium resinovorum]|uniref:serine hydrolase domain-containing protein n=1 Tax=Novosphingobium TaxID=165696 RepID=UPI001B3C5B63|nr:MULTISPECIES: serine hydrolase domain-containing protein [Novosphingobium]MBF7014295.1 serine hydrolase [Novosphingobium sp. HR1a]WJM25224.1 serine hydrolase domain-containing protein [Novosphingobium resinovorum]
MSQQARIDVAALDALFAPYDRTDAPGFAVGVALKGIPGYRRGFGMANVELPVALSPSIRMRIGSTTKHFCVLAVMLLAEEGKLAIADSPRAYIPELPAWADPITIEQLMAHTSGMRDSLDLIFSTAGPGVAADAGFQLDLLAGLDSVNAPAGTTWNYNNGGYVLLTEIAARVSGMPFADFLRTRILDPIGMADTLLRPLDTDLLPNSATQHLSRSDGGWSRGIFGAWIGGEGGIVSTVNDMLAWLRHMSHPIVGSAETWAQMRTPRMTHGYGLGLNMTKHRGLDTVHHAGGVVGGSSQMLKVLGHELDIILMTNGRSALDLYSLVDAIIDCCIQGLPPAPQDAACRLVEGTFHSARTGQVLSLVGHAGQQAVVMGGMTLPTTRDADGRMTVAILPTDLRILPVETDGVTALETTEFGEADHLAPVTVPECTTAASLIGRYESRAARLAADIRIDEAGAARIVLSGPLGGTDYLLEPLGPDLWRAVSPTLSPPGGTLEFGAGGFLFTSGRTVRLAFERSARA